MNLKTTLPSTCIFFTVALASGSPAVAATPIENLPKNISSLPAATSEREWAMTATPFKIAGGESVNNVKINWMLRDDADLYKIYRDGKEIGTASGNTFDDYGLAVGKTYTYHVEAYQGEKKVAQAIGQSTTTFIPSGGSPTYDNKNGKLTSEDTTEKPKGMKIGNTYYIYRMQKDSDKVWTITESHSTTGLNGSWSKERTIASYPNVNFEGNAFRYNPKTKKVVFSSHYEDEGGYNAAKIFLAQITPKGGIEVGTKARPLGHDSRDQSLFVDDDGTGYLLSATNTNQDINIYKLDETWTKPISLVNTICRGKRRETPAIIKKDGEYYFFSSRASGWYPSQTMYASTTNLAGEWTELREIGNNSTFGTQFNNIQTRGTDRQTYGVWSYHWGAQYNHPDPDGNFPRISVAAFNHGYASMDYYRYLEFDEKYGIIPVQSGENLTLGAPVTSQVKGVEGIPPSCLTDGVALSSAPSFQKSSNSALGAPYLFVIDMQKPAVISEINLATKLINGSEAAYRYTIEGSTDGKSYTMLVNGKTNWVAGFQILPIADKQAYRYLRLRVYDVVSLHQNKSVMWADGIYEFTAFGKWQ